MRLAVLLAPCALAQTRGGQLSFIMDDGRACTVEATPTASGAATLTTNCAVIVNGVDVEALAARLDAVEAHLGWVPPSSPPPSPSPSAPPPPSSPPSAPSPSLPPVVAEPWQQIGSGNCRCSSCSSTTGGPSDFTALSLPHTCSSCQKACADNAPCRAYECSFDGGTCELWTAVPDYSSGHTTRACRLKP